MLPQIASRIEEINRFIEGSIASAQEEQLKSYLCKLGAVMVCGTIERSVEIIILNKIEHRAHPQVVNFIKSHFKRGTNYDCEAICQLLQRFDSGWYREFRNFVEADPEMSQSVSSCYGARNAVSHGIAHGIAAATLKKHFEATKKLIIGLTQATR